MSTSPTSASSGSSSRSIAPPSSSQLLTRPRSGSSPLRLEVLPVSQPAPTLSSSSSSHSLSSSLSPSPPTSFHSAPRSGSSTVSTPSKLRNVTSHSNFSSTPPGGRSRSGSITSPRPANLALRAPPSPSFSPINSISASTSSPYLSGSGLSTARRPRSGSAAPVLSNNSFEQKAVLNNDGDVNADLAQAQLNLTLGKGLPQSTQTWDSGIPDILVLDENEDEISGNVSPRLEPHDEEEEKIISTYQILNLIIPDISEAAAAAEAAEQLELEQQQADQQAADAAHSQPAMVSSSGSDNTNNSLDITTNNTSNTSSTGNSASNPNEQTMSEYPKSSLATATDTLTITSLGVGAGFVLPSVSGSSTRLSTPTTPHSGSTSALTLNSSGTLATTAPGTMGAGTANMTTSGVPGTATPPATLAARFRLPFSSKAFIPPSRPASMHPLNPQPGETSYAGSSDVLGINNPMQSNTNLANGGSGIRSSFFEYRFANFFSAGSSIAPSVRSFALGGGHGTGDDGDSGQELYEVEFNVPLDPAQEERMRMDHTTWGRIRKVLRAGFPGRDLDPRTRKPRYKYPTNNIKTTKYTLLTFLPVNLLFQFKRFYNIYFLCAAIFVCAEPSLSPVTEIMPLTLVLTITAVKDALEDYRRYQQDKRSNSLECTLVKDGKLIPIKSKDIRPGDVLKICKNDKIPADVVLLSTSMDEGACFVETSELDGETNLKRKTALTVTSELTRLDQITRVTGKITTEMPNERLARLDGRIKVRYDGAVFNVETLESRERHHQQQRRPMNEKSGREVNRDTSSNALDSIASSRGQSGVTRSQPKKKVDEVAPVTMSNVALRGCWLKNTEWVYGVVLYAGVDTKMMRNLKNTGLKFSTIETKLNRMIVAIFVFNAFLLVTSMCLAYVSESSEFLRAPLAWYTTQEGPEFVSTPSSARVFVGQLMNFYVVYTFVIPISVFISVELCRIVQALWMIWDEEMRSYNDGPLSQAELEEIANEQGLDGSTTDVDAEESMMQELRQRKLVKTTTESTQSSTLQEGNSTINQTKRKTISKFLNKHRPEFLRRKKKPAKDWTRMHVRNSNLNEDLGAVEYVFSDKTGTLTRNVMKLSKWHIGGRTFHELQQPGSLGQRMRDPSISDEEYDLLMAFCRNIVVCHAVLPCEDTKTGELLYEAQSPDESALLEALRDNGVVLKAKTKDSVTVEIFGLITETYKVLKVLEFTSDRKCMSVIIDTPQGIQLFCKGADNVILARADMVENEPMLMRQLDATVRRFSIAGLRTLMLAWRPLSPEEYKIFDEMYTKAEYHIGDGEDGTEDREELIRVACETIEGRLRLLGCTAIEDRLQDQVPETIEYLMEADIKVWLLTGDKQETAINIGISSRLISPAMKILVLNVKVDRDCRLVLEYFIDKMKERELDEERYRQEYLEHASNKPGIESPEKDRYALVVNGESLAFVLGNEIYEDMFLRIGTSCHSVICCRVTPLQKALVVKLVRKKLHKVTLAIGDGANDISMIQAAHVGVGIEGMEGAQAARSSDFSFKQFKNLKRLLTIHGRYSYLRMSKIIFFSFYKSICLITVQFWFGFMNGWSGGSLYDERFLTLWNVVFTAALPIITACFEKDVSEESIGRYPKLYKAVKDGLYWNVLTITGWGIASFWHSGALFGSIYASVTHGIVDGNSIAMDSTLLSFYAGSLVLITVTLKMLLMISHWTLPIFLAFSVSMAGYIIIFIGLEVVGLLDSGTFAMLHSMPFYYLGLLVIPVGCLLPDYALAYYLRQFYPTDAQIIQEDQRLASMKAAAAAGGGSSKGKNGKNVQDDLEDQEVMVEMNNRSNRRHEDEEYEDSEDSEDEVVGERRKTMLKQSEKQAAEKRKA
ncbi:hypothetical protein BGZ99_004460 [Dissophora globulifera]|uniref:P-type phospholipid transporter n=1 Tax=Dissophora globulifera TaxID=979702 RepID=A0A9P6V072_9FUNG|nr:hypothetical protein BGZ99_004460 [Dissophora globulifera]